MIILRNIGLRRGDKVLLEDASVTLRPGQNLALIGANGSGKSSLFALLTGSLGADAGTIEGMEQLQLAHMAQEVHPSSLPAIEFVWRGHEQVAALRDKIHALEDAGQFAETAVLHQELEALDGYQIEHRAGRLLRGLGFADEVQSKAVSEFSGGWRIRLNLARALMQPSDVLLLDEPTNHLDLDATLWLQQWLQRYAGTLLLISHDRDFIDATCERILHIHGLHLTDYAGNYSDFERQRAERMAAQQASYDKQQRRIAEIDGFVRRFRYKATKARQAQSRLKELERMQALAPAHVDSPFDFSFPDIGKTSDPLLVLDDADLGYGAEPVLKSVQVVLRPGSRLGLLGRNGAGKSTLLKSMIGALPLLSGHKSPGTHLRIGYFDQQQLEALDLQASPAQHLQRLTPDTRAQDILDFLGGFDFRGKRAEEPVAPLSGGEKARLALAMIVWQNPNLLVLDEPTNHLDLEMRHAMEVALQRYEGALVLVSHDRHLLRNTVEELILVHDGKVDAFEDDLEGYENWLLKGFAAPVADTPRNNGESRREQRQREAAHREKMRPLRKKIDRAEADMAEVERSLEELRAALEDSSLYTDERRDDLAALLHEEGELKSRAEALDETWLALQEQLEDLTAAQA